MLKYIPKYAFSTRISEMWKLKLQYRIRSRTIIGAVCACVTNISTPPGHTSLEMHTLPALLNFPPQMLPTEGRVTLGVPRLHTSKIFMT